MSRDGILKPRFTKLHTLGREKDGRALWLAQDGLLDNRLVVLKQFQVPAWLANDHLQLLSICDSYLSLSHPGIAKPLLFCEYIDSLVYVSYEYIDGKPFLPTIHSLSNTSFFDIVLQLCSTLYYLHSRGYAHLDLHPANILLEPHSDGRHTLKLLDVPLLPLQLLQRVPDIIAFHPHYSAPEVIAGESFDYRAHLYSVGVLLCSALDVASHTSSYLLAPHAPTPNGLSFEAVSPAFLVPILTTLLNTSRDKRFPSAYFLYEDLVAHLKDNKIDYPASYPFGTVVHSPPFIATTESHSGISALDSYLTNIESEPHLQLNLSGLPGSGVHRLSRLLALYATLRGCHEAFVSPSKQLLSSSLNCEAPRSAPRPTVVLPGTDVSQSQIDTFLHHFDHSLVITTELTTIPLSLHRVAEMLEYRVTDLHVSPLPMSSALQFIDLFLHINTLSSAVKEGIAMRCFCLPGFLSSELRGFIERGILKKRGPAWEPMESPLDSPGSENTTALMRSTLQNLTPQDVAFLTIFAIAPFAMDIGMAIALASSDEHRARHLLESACAIGYMGSQNDSVFLNSSLFREAISAFQSPEATLSLARNSLNVLRTRTTHQPSQHDALLAAFAVHAHDNAAVIHHALAASHYFESMNRLGDALHYCRLAADAVPVSEIHRHSEIFERVLELLDRIGNTDEFNAIACILQKTLPEDAYLQRINLFKLLAHHHSELLQLRESTRFAAMGMRLAKRQNLRNEISNCLEILAQNQLRQGRPTNAIKTISVCISIRRNEQIVNDYESAFGILAGAYYMEGNYTKALACAVEVLRRLPNRPRDRNKIPVLNNLGILYMESGDLALARKVLSKCRQLAEAWAEFRGISHCHSNLVVFHLYEGDLSQSVIHARRVFQVLEMARALYGYGQSQLSLAEALLLRGQIDDSLDAIAKAQAASVESGDAMNELLARLQKAWVLYHAGAYEQAKASFTEIELPLDKAGYRVHQVSCGLGLSNVETARGEFQFARERLERIYARLPRQHIISDLVYRISKGRYHAAMNEYAQARRSFAAAEALARSHGFRPYVFEAQLSLAQCFLALGESEEAAYYLKRLYGLNERLRYRLLEPWLHLAFADHLASAGDFWEEKRHLLNARTALLELAHNIGDLTLREHFLNRPDSRSLLQRSEDVEDLLYSHSSRIAHAPPVSNALESIARINEQLHRRDSMKSTLSLIVDEALRLSGAERGIIFLFDPSGREELKVARNLGRRSLADARRYTRTALLAIRRGDIVFAADTFTDPTFSGSESITHHRIRSVVCVPLRSRLSIIGALYLDSRRRGLHARPDLLKSLEIFSQQAAAALERAARYFHINEENRKLRENARLDHPKLIGQGSHFTHLKQLIAAAGSSHLPVLILGESGTGKELIARAIHESGPRAEEPFLSVDCGALPDNLVESELFGYRKGAFTGAETNKEGLFVAARGGTIFLDEIANTSPVLQTKLLRAIQEREIRPLGSTESMPFKARIVAATNRDLRKESREGRFRQDLLFRLNGLIIETTPLRNRKGDIPLLIGHFLQEYRHRTGRKIWSMSDQALQALGHHDWPGNVRELQNCIERAMALARGDTIDLGDLPDSIRSTSVVSWDKKNGEHRLIEEALSLCAGDKTRAADYIGWNRQKLYRKMAHYNIPRDFGRRNTA